MIGYLRRHHVGLIALFIALGGSAYAASLPRHSVGTRQLKPQAVTAAKIHLGAVTRSKLRDGAVTAGKLAPGVLAPRDDRPAVSVTKDRRAVLTAPDLVRTAVSFTDEEFDTAGSFSPARPSVVTAPRAGVYAIDAEVNYGSGSDGYRQAAIAVGSGCCVARQQVRPVTPDGEDTIVQVHALTPLSAGAQLRLLLLQHGAPDSDIAEARLTMLWAGPNP